MFRRNFLKALPASLFLTGFPNLGFTKTNKDGRLIVINLEGGMDGLCAVPPLGDTPFLDFIHPLKVLAKC